MTADKKILVLEDERALQNLYREKLIGEGFEVIQAISVDQAFREIKTNNINLIILDIMLPGGKNGFDFLERIKKDPRYNKIPVIIMSNLDSEEKTAREIGANAYLVKANVSIDKVVSKVKELLDFTH